MKLIASGVTRAAAIVRSPSFSRSSSSTTIRISPRLMCEIASSTVMSGMALLSGCPIYGGQHLLHVSGQHVDLEVHPTTNFCICERRHRERVRNERNLERFIVDRS